MNLAPLLLLLVAGVPSQPANSPCSRDCETHVHIIVGSEQEGPIPDSPFFLGGGLALLLALVGWSDQIRGLSRTAREREVQLLRTYGIEWAKIQTVIRPQDEDNPLDRLVDLLRLLPTGIGDEVGARLIHNFQTLHQISMRLSSLSTIRYWLLFSLSVQMLVAGVHLGSSWLPLTGHYFHYAAGSLIVVVILILTLLVGRGESRFEVTIGHIEDDLRLASDEKTREDHGR